MNRIDAIVFDIVGSLADASIDAAPDKQLHAYDDAAPALAELKSLGVTLVAVSTLPLSELTRFLAASGLTEYFDDARSCASTTGDPSDALRDALAARSIAPDRALYITDTSDGLRAARATGMHGILMMNDPDEAMKLTALNPAGGIVSLLELPDFVRFVSARHNPAH